MPSDALDNLARIGHLDKVPFSQALMDKMLAAAQSRLTDAQRTAYSPALRPPCEPLTTTCPPSSSVSHVMESNNSTRRVPSMAATVPFMPDASVCNDRSGSLPLRAPSLARSPA